MKKYLVGLISTFGCLIFASAPQTPQRENPLLKVTLSCLYETISVEEWENALRKFDIELKDLYTLQGGPEITYGQFIEGHRPTLFPRRDVLLQKISPEGKVKEPLKPILTDEETVAKYVRVLFSSQTVNDSLRARACCALRNFPINLSNHFFNKDSLKSLLKDSSFDDVKNAYALCEIPNMQDELVGELLLAGQGKEAEVVHNLLTSKTKVHKDFLRDFKDFLMKFHRVFPGGAKLLKRFELDKAGSQSLETKPLGEKKRLLQLFFTNHKNFFTSKQQGTLLATVERYDRAVKAKQCKNQMTREINSSHDTQLVDTSSNKRLFFLGAGLVALGGAFYLYYKKRLKMPSQSQVA